jgi:hypothetical protein
MSQELPDSQVKKKECALLFHGICHCSGELESSSIWWHQSWVAPIA